MQNLLVTSDKIVELKQSVDSHIDPAMKNLVRFVIDNTPFAPVYSCSGHGREGHLIIASGFSDILHLTDLFMRRSKQNRNLKSVNIVNVSKPALERFTAFKFVFVGYEGLAELYALFGAEFDENTIEEDKNVKRRPSKLAAAYEMKKLDAKRKAALESDRKNQNSSTNDQTDGNTEPQVFQDKVAFHRERTHVVSKWPVRSELEVYTSMIDDIKDGKFVPDFFFRCNYTLEAPSLPLQKESGTEISRSLVIELPDMLVEVLNPGQFKFTQYTPWSRSESLTLQALMDKINEQFSAYRYQVYVDSFNAVPSASIQLGDRIEQETRTIRLTTRMLYTEV